MEKNRNLKQRNRRYKLQNTNENFRTENTRVETKILMGELNRRTERAQKNIGES